MSENDIEWSTPPEPDWWFVIAVDKDGAGTILDATPDVFDRDMIDGDNTEDNCVEHPDEMGLYRIDSMRFYVSTDWETGYSDDWGWADGDVTVLWRAPHPDGEGT